MTVEEQAFQIEKIPAVLYGEETDKVYLFLHGKRGYKEEAKEFGQIVCPRGWQVVGVDLPEHGSRKGETGGFDPWHVVPELQTVMACLQRRWSRIALRANSIGAWFSMLAFYAQPPERSLFVSPVLNMERLIRSIMQWAGVTEEQLRTHETIRTGFGEVLSWQYYQYAREHPIEAWPCPTSILYGEKDALTPRWEVDDFVRLYHCDLTVIEGGEHWLHTPEQLNLLRQWTDDQTALELTPEECLFFAGKPGELELYEAFRRRLFREVGAVKVRVQKTQVTFQGKHGFAFVSHPRRRRDMGIIVSFGLFRQQQSERIQHATEPYPNRWTHHMAVKSGEEIDEELMGWIREAYWASEQKR